MCSPPRRMIVLASACALSWLVLQTPDGGTAASEPSTAGHDIERAFELAKAGGEDYETARHILEALPADEAIPGIIGALSPRPVPQRADMRELAYSVLSHHGAAATEEGREQLVKGLGDSSSAVQQICCAVLDPTILEAELGRLDALLADSGTDANQKESILKRLSGWGNYASDSLATIEPIFADANNEERVRWFAARALLHIGGLERAMVSFGELDTTGQKVVMWSLAQYISQAAATGTYTLDKLDPGASEARDQARKLTMNTMKSPDRETRLAAFQALFLVFGFDAIVFDSPEDYHWHPDAQAALEDMAANDPDPELRKGAARVLDTLDQGAARIQRFLRRQRKQQEQDAGG